jgi:hypothetical protein
MEDKEILQNVADAVAERAFTFQFDTEPPTGLWHRLLIKLKLRKPAEPVTYTVKPLTFKQLHDVSALLLDIGLDIDNLTSDQILTAMRDHGWTLAKIVAIGACDSRKDPSDYMVKHFYDNLGTDDESQMIILQILKAMRVQVFIRTITSLRNLNILDRRLHANADSARPQGVNP